LFKREDDVNNEKECRIWVPLGYSRNMVEGTPSGHEVQKLRHVLGHFTSIRFHTLRFSEDVFEVTMTRKEVPPEGRDAVETVAGMLGDQHLLLDGATLVTVTNQTKDRVELHFWRNGA
jgi:hypothetical protein